MATQLSIVNNILRELREDTVTSVADTSYSQLIARFVNRAKRDMGQIEGVEWPQYITTVSFSILGDSTTTTYQDATITDAASLLRHGAKWDLPMAFCTTSGSKQQLYDMPYDKLLYIRNTWTDSTTSTSLPTSFAVAYDDTNGGWGIELLYASDNAYTWTTYWYVPQDDLALDGTDDSTALKLPSYPLELRALYYALNERGEEMGQPGGIAWKTSEDAIASAADRALDSNKVRERLGFFNDESL